MVDDSGVVSDAVMVAIDSIEAGHLYHQWSAVDVGLPCPHLGSPRLIEAGLDSARLSGLQRRPCAGHSVRGTERGDDIVMLITAVMIMIITMIIRIIMIMMITTIAVSIVLAIVEAIPSSVGDWSRF